MTPSEATRQYKLSKWAAIISECKESGEKIYDWTEKHGISRDQYYYWQRKLKNACLDSVKQPAFIEITNPVEVNTPKPELLLSSDTKQSEQPQGDAGAVLRINGIELQINNNASEELIKNLIGAISYVKEC